ncbi:GGDEF domain-containing protein [Peloplasma aerotolerans]|uniref:GGDEF domain-containing protein n=1 Tax=Peloplasma aerotolerans TaxID=3044389 RepID=A0AAW6U9G3_9MOLU|nr:GGDEF domain-containing protein [Mariniplasma sp. M4Ah]MDI6453314.1 GGDEF domain-containing protein [Mariniplasma sp. M4Ah]
MKNKYFESSSQELKDRYNLDIYTDILLGREDRVLLYADISEMENLEFFVISGSLEIFNYENHPSIFLKQLLESIDYSCKYAEIGGKKEYFDYISSELSDFTRIVDVTFPVLVKAQRFWIRLTTFPSVKNPSVIAIYMNDVTDTMILIEENYEKAHRDSLTKLLNKYTLDYHYGLRYQRENFHAIYMDIDNLKKVNDVDGHAVGNAYIKAFADILLAYETEYDRFYRIGGDEFVGLFFRPENEVKQMAEEILRKTNLIQVPHSKKSITVSIGITQATIKDDVIRKADDLLYKVKKSGKNAYLYEIET